MILPASAPRAKEAAAKRGFTLPAAPITFHDGGRLREASDLYDACLQLAALGRAARYV